jgi:hypothetical protein
VVPLRGRSASLVPANRALNRIATDD